MAVMQVNPNRMELSKLKKKLKTAVRGHKLLKDKRDEMVRRFMIYIRENKQLREQVEASLTKALKSYALASAVMSPQAMQTAVAVPMRKFSLDVSKQNIMSVDVPVISIKQDASTDSTYPYGLLQTPGELDKAISTLETVLEDMVRLAEIEKTCNLLADEIEKTRRRVNALEYVMIPQMEETIRSITMKLEENDRGALTRLMKVKEMMN